MNDTLFPEEGKFDFPELPYNGTSGWSGTETSRERATQNDSEGTTKSVQVKTLQLLLEAGRRGLNWRELAEVTGLHHGGASGVLSVLHKTNRVERLTEVRNKCKVYVHPLFVEGRNIEQFKSRNRACPHCGGLL